MFRKYHTILVVISIALWILSGPVYAQEKLPQSPALSGQKLALVIAYRDFEDTEFTVPRKIFEDQGASITIASTEIGTARGMYWHEVKTDILIEDLEASNFDAVIFIGGMGVKPEYWENPKAHKIAKETLKAGKVLAAICWAPVILANADLLRGKKATGNTYENAHQQLVDKGAEYTGKTVAIDGNIVTAFGPESAEPFARAVIDVLR